MKNVLLVVAPGYEAPNALAYAVSRARELGGGIVVLAVLDGESLSRVAAAFTDVGWVGERVSDDVVEALGAERRTLAEMQVEQLAEEIRTQGVEAMPLVREGDPSDVCARLVREHDVGLAVLVAERRSWVTRFLSRSAPVRLPTFAGCEIKVMED